jgi:hypothetical protein
MPTRRSSFRWLAALMVSVAAPDSGSSSLVPPTASSRKRRARWPELQDAVIPLHHPFEERLEDVVDILAVGARADNVMDELAVPPVERLDRAGSRAKDVVDQFDIGRFGCCGRRSRQGPSPDGATLTR